MKQFLTPPLTVIPKTARWRAVFPIADKQEIWIVDLRDGRDSYVPLFCFDGVVPETLDVSRLIEGWGTRFFLERSRKNIGRSAPQNIRIFESNRDLASFCPARFQARI